MRRLPVRYGIMVFFLFLLASFHASSASTQALSASDQLVCERVIGQESRFLEKMIRKTTPIRKSGSKSERIAFFEPYRKSSSLTHEVKGKKERWFIDGNRAEKLGQDPTALANAGIYRFTTPAGEKRIFKILPIDLSVLDKPPIVAEEGKELSYSELRFNGARERVLPAVLEEVNNAYWAESLTGPKLYRFGSVLVDGVERPYLEMEELFADSEKLPSGRRFEISKKHWGHGNAVASEYRDLTYFYENLGGEKTLESIGELLLAPLEKGVSPHDFDFAVNLAGAVRYIDSGQWMVGEPFEVLLEDYRDLFHRILPRLHKRDGGEVRPKEAAAVRAFLVGAIRKLKYSTVLKQDEKMQFLDEVFRDAPYEESRVERLYQSGMIEEGVNRKKLDPVKVMKTFYDSL